MFPEGAVDCRHKTNQHDCGELCVGKGWMSKLTISYVDAQKICDDLGYSNTVVEYGGNSGKQCKYPGKKYGSPDLYRCLLYTSPSPRDS